MDVEPPKRKRGRPRKRVLVPGELQAVLNKAAEAAGKPKPPPPQVPKPPPPPPPKAKANGKESAQAELQKRVEQIISFIERECLVPEGRLMGTPIKLEDWQKEAIWAIYGNPAGTRRARSRSCPRRGRRGRAPRCASCS